MPFYDKIPRIEKVPGVLGGFCVVEEKVDGSQVSFFLDDYGDLVLRSRNHILDPDNLLDPSFDVFCIAVLDRKEHLTHGLTYYGEYLRKRRQNQILYTNVPDGFVYIYDIRTDKRDDIRSGFLTMQYKAAEAHRLGFTPVNFLGHGNMLTFDQIKEFASQESCLGGKMEGVCVKNYTLKSKDHNYTFAKYINEDYKEVKLKSRKASKIDTLIEDYATEARYRKAIQHLAESGELNFEMSDIPKLMREIGTDLHEEEYEVFKERLAKAYWKDFVRGISKNFPAFYRGYLERLAFGVDEEKEE